MSLRSITLLTLATVCCGCAETETAPQNAQQDGKPGGAGMKVTDDIGEFDPAANKEVASSEVKISNPLTGALEAYQPLKEKVAGLGIDHAVNLFQALEGRYPKDHDEFMEKVIKANHIKLPTLGKGKSYEYDVENHKLVVVIDPKQN